MIYCRGLKFPLTVVVLLVLESDGACTGLNDHCARKVQCWFYYDATKPEVIENRIFEGADCLKAALSCGVTSLKVVVVSARSVRRGINEAVTLLCLVSSPSTPTYRLKTQDLKHIDYHD